MTLQLVISPRGYLRVEEARDGEAVETLSETVVRRVRGAFEQDASAGLLHLATVELQTPMAGSFAYVRSLARRCLLMVCQQAAGHDEAALVPPPDEAELAALALDAPAFRGVEYLSAKTLADWWRSLDDHVRSRASKESLTVATLLERMNPRWRAVGRVTFHLAENKRDPDHPFAFLATHAARFSEHGQIQHQPLGQALRNAASAKDRQKLLVLLTPVHQAAERCPWVNALIETGGIYQPLAWTPGQALQFLRDVPALEEAGLVVRVPDWWKGLKSVRPQVSVQVGGAKKAVLGVDAMLDFSVGVALEGEQLTEAELQELLASAGGLVRLRGRWIELDREQLAEALAHWKRVEHETKDGVSFFEAMRWLAGAGDGAGTGADVDEASRQWVGVQPGPWLEETLARLRDPARFTTDAHTHLNATLRPYQRTGVQWLRFTTSLGLGACLADDMGLGKTIQVLALLLHLRDEARSDQKPKPSLLIVPASLLANWRSEIDRFAPSLMTLIVHPAETDLDLGNDATLRRAVTGCDLVITSYGMLTRLKPLQDQTWRLVILDEAQAIKNSGTRQARAVKKLTADARVAMTGTPIENRLSDLWSLFDFLNPGLLGDAAAFKRFSKQLTAGDGASHYGPLRKLVQPYILRRLKTDKSVIADLPEKTEVRTFCGLTKPQAALYEQSVRELEKILGEVEGIQRRGVVLAFLMRLKQICNHPAQWRGDGDFDPNHSGKFQRLSDLCQELAQRQEKALIFTQFREIIDPLAQHLEGVFGRSGLVLHGGTPVRQRPALVRRFQEEAGPPFFILSLKAGGTGLNLTAASHVIHFDRWWNPAVENQATDRAFRIGQKNNVLVHKLVCRGTVEEKIDAMIAGKVELAQALLDEGGEKLLTEMNDRELLAFVALDVNKAGEL